MIQKNVVFNKFLIEYKVVFLKIYQYINAVISLITTILIFINSMWHLCNYWYDTKVYNTIKIKVSDIIQYNIARELNIDHFDEVC